MFGWLCDLLYDGGIGYGDSLSRRDENVNRDDEMTYARDLNLKQFAVINDTLINIKSILESNRLSDSNMLEILTNNHENSMDILNKIQGNIATRDDIETFMKTQNQNQNGKTSNHKVQPSEGANSVTPKLNVLIAASMRTGSSFFGELFRQHPQFLYIFEPLRALKLNDYDPLLTIKGVDMMHDIYECNFASTAKTLLDVLYNPETPLAKRNIVPAWVNEKYCSGWDSAYKTYAKCSPMTPQKSSESCRSFEKVAIKVIRVFDAYSLLHLMKDPNINLRTINVLRDPRGMMSSVMPIHISNWQAKRKSDIDMKLYAHQFDDGLQRRLEQYCTTMLRNVILSKHSTLLPKQNYLPIRYEDMSEHPLEVAKHIFEFLGLQMHDNVKRWIEENTKEDANGNHLFYAWQTKRNSREASERWRYKMSYELVQKIENTGDCPQFMSIMGYKRAESFEQLLDTSVSYLLPINN
ncbi:carbohydrate sulfotransferase 1-like [Glandiceps talaboti]